MVMDTLMNLDKSTKRIEKRVKKGFQGYPLISIAYFGYTTTSATDVIVSFVIDDGAVPQEQKFSCQGNAREDQTIQTTLLKIIERADAKTVVDVGGITVQ